jgi:hypothetical protein
MITSQNLKLRQKIIKIRATTLNIKQLGFSDLRVFVFKPTFQTVDTDALRKSNRFILPTVVLHAGRANCNNLTDMIKNILIPLILLTMISCSNADSNNNDCCFASSAMIFWKTNSIDSEIEIKKVLTDLSVEYRDLDSQTWDSETSTIGGIRDYKLSWITVDSNSWTSLMLHLNSTLIDKISQQLSNLTDSPVIAFLEYDQDAWGYCLYQNGQLIDNFWNSHLTVDFPIDKCTADIDLISSKFQVDKELIKPYLIDIANKEDLGKVNENDEFDLDNHWVRVDFMEKLGLYYPESGKWFYIKEKGIND